MCVYVYVYIYVRVCVCIYIYVCVCMCMYIYVCVCVCIYMCVYVYVYTSMYIYIYIYIYMRLGFSKMVYKSRTIFVTLCDIKQVTLYIHDVSKILGKTSEVIFFIFIYVLFVCMYVPCTLYMVFI